MHRVAMEALLDGIKGVAFRVAPLVRQQRIVPVQLQAKHVHVKELLVGRHSGRRLDEPRAGPALQLPSGQVDDSTGAKLPAAVLAVNGGFDELERALELNVLRIVLIRHVCRREVDFQLATRRRINYGQGGIRCSSVDGRVAHAAPEERDRIVPRTFEYLWG